ncbi:MAG: phenylalanine--tRNA ligase beta subunit-related protein [Bacillota bacterium]|nr:phenylalanine--tRNA ligase beta subunit-related protein [Bacillota bacterium]
MLFKVAPEVFELFPDYIVGVVVVRGMSNTLHGPGESLESACERARVMLGESPRHHPMVSVWREAFLKAGYNPNRFSPSIDALTSRVVKSGGIPSINGAVDIINAHSLTYLLPMGAHDLGPMKGDFEVRKSRPGEVFSPMGHGEKEIVDTGEIVYADDLEVRTRRWIWRQGDNAKVNQLTTHLFCPIDGFAGTNLQQVLAARASIANALVEHLGGEASQFLLEREHASAVIA